MAFLSAARSMTVRTVAHRLGLQWREFKLRRIAFAATWPHARPLTFAFRWLFLATFTARIVYTCTKRNWKVKLRAAATSAASASVRTFEAAAAIAAATPLSCFTPATTTFTLDCVMQIGSCNMQKYNMQIYIISSCKVYLISNCYLVCCYVCLCCLYVFEPNVNFLPVLL